MRGGPPPSHLEQEDREAEDGGRSEVARAELEQQQRRCKLPARMAGLARAQGTAGLAWAGVAAHGIAGARVGWAGVVIRTSHALLPNLVSTCEVSKSLAVPAGGSGAASRSRGSASGCMRNVRSARWAPHEAQGARSSTRKF